MRIDALVSFYAFRQTIVNYEAISIQL